MGNSCKDCSKKFKEWEYFELRMTSSEEDFDKSTIIDLITWKHWINNALKRCHGIFGEAIEYEIMNQSNRIIFCKVGYNDCEDFAIAISTYISTSDLMEKPLTVTMLQKTSRLGDLKIEDEDRLWHQNALREV